jgi:hypothetical protein
MSDELKITFKRRQETQREVLFCDTQHGLNLNFQDKTRTEFSTMEVTVCMTHLLGILPIRSDLELKTWPEQPLGSLSR